MKRWMATVGVVGLMVMALAMPSGTWAQGSVSEGCAVVNDADGVYSGAGVGQTFAAGDHITVTGGDTTISFFFDGVEVPGSPFLGTVSFIIPTDGFHNVSWNTTDGAALTWSVSCEPGPPTPKNTNDCKNGGWKNLKRADGSSFKSQGECIQYVNKGR